MRRDDFIDFFYVEAHQLDMHVRLENWSRWVEHRARMGGKVAPMWANYRSKARQWHEPELRPPTNELDGGAMETAVAMLPYPNRDALRWSYVWKGGPLHQARKMGVTKEGLFKLVRDGRQMLINRKI